MRKKDSKRTRGEQKQKVWILVILRSKTLMKRVNNSLMSSRSVMERNTAYICTGFQEGDVVGATCVVWWLVGDSKDKHDKLGAQLGRLGHCYRCCPGQSQTVLKLICVTVI